MPRPLRKAPLAPPLAAIVYVPAVRHSTPARDRTVASGTPRDTVATNH
ncbi:hypothetical protein RKE30_20450 [Streptomyces sp. Li-HN-5-11]|nr:hypothetical protein [Streptomyces sp. Li-HN-5-11]WNM32616.1 hypothetical protein RKE30_20450 [Streptomyces sp. Li-HN-5-11]